MIYSFFELRRNFRDLPGCSLIEDLSLMDKDEKKEASFFLEEVDPEVLEFLNTSDSEGEDWRENIKEAIKKGYKVYRVTDEWNQWTYGFVREKETRKKREKEQ
jgi:hypothetical protein